MARSVAQIEEEIQELSTAEKAQLLRALWEQLDGNSEADSAIDQAWRAEARRRDQEIDQGEVDTVPADEVFKRLEASLRK